MAKPPPGTPLVTDHPLLNGLCFYAPFLEGSGTRSYDYGPRRCASFRGPVVTAADAGFTTSTASHVFSGWADGQLGPALVINAADTITSAGGTTQASGALFKAPGIIYPNQSVPFTFFCKWLSFSTPLTGGDAIQLLDFAEQDSTNSELTLAVDNGSGTLAGDNVNGTSNLAPIPGAWNSSICIKPPGATVKLTYLNNGAIQTGVTLSGMSAANTITDPYISVGTMWANAGAVGQYEGNGTSWTGLIECAAAWTRPLTIAEGQSMIDNPYQLFALPTSKRWFPMSSSSPTPTPTGTSSRRTLSPLGTRTGSRQPQSSGGNN